MGSSEPTTTPDTPQIKPTVPLVNLQKPINRIDSEAVPHFSTPNTERLLASRKEEVIRFLRQVIGSERALRAKLHELQDEQESVQVYNFRFEHILRQCVGQQAVEIEKFRREVEASRQALLKERDQRLSEEVKRRKVESLLDDYKCRLASLKTMALSAQRHLITAESLLLAAAAEDEEARASCRSISHHQDIPHDLARDFQRRRDLWRLRQQQCNNKDPKSKACGDDALAEKALEDLQTVVEVVSRTFCIPKESVLDNSDLNITPLWGSSEANARIFQKPNPKELAQEGRHPEQGRSSEELSRHEEGGGPQEGRCEGRSPSPSGSRRPPVGATPSTRATLSGGYGRLKHSMDSTTPLGIRSVAQRRQQSVSLVRSPVTRPWEDEEALRSPSSQRVYELLRRIEDQVNSRRVLELPPRATIPVSSHLRSINDRKISVMSVFSHHTTVSSVDAGDSGGPYSQEEFFIPGQAFPEIAILSEVGTQTEKTSSFRWVRAVRTEFLPVPPPSYIPPPNKRCPFSLIVQSPAVVFPSIRMYRPAAPPLLPRGLVRLRPA